MAINGGIAIFAFSDGAVTWVYLSEVFPTPVRANGQALGSATHWIMDAQISAIFPILAATSGDAPFVLFAAMMVARFFRSAVLLSGNQGCGAGTHQALANPPRHRIRTEPRPPGSVAPEVATKSERSPSTIPAYQILVHGPLPIVLKPAVSAQRC